MSRKNRKLILAIGIVWGIYFVLLIPFYFFILYPLQNKYSDANANIEGVIKKNVLASAVNMVKLESVIDEEVARSKELMEQFMFHAGDVSDLTFAFNEMAKDLDLKNFNVSNKTSNKFGNIQGCEHIAEGQMQFTFDSDFPSFVRFIQRLESYKPVIFVDTFSISLPRGVKDDNQLNQASVLISFLIIK